MIRIKTNGKTRGNNTPSKSDFTPTGRSRTAARRAGRLLLQRARAIVALLVVALLGWGMQGAWRHYAPQISQRGNYLLTEEQITITPQPEWISSNVCKEAVRNAALAGRLSVLNDAFAQVVEDAFVLHPWIKSVDKITKRYPAGVHVELTYRRPVAVIELVSQKVVQLVPVDRSGIHLPLDDVPKIRRRYLPRIVGIIERPPVGQPWSDQRVLGATEIVAKLAREWDTLRLKEILPLARPEVRGQLRYFVYDLITLGGTRIIWGAAPGTAPPGEEKFAAKLDRLRSCVATYGPQGWLRGPAVVDVRHSKLDITPRTAKNEKAVVKQAAKRKKLAK